MTPNRHDHAVPNFEDLDSFLYNNVEEKLQKILNVT